MLLGAFRGGNPLERIVGIALLSEAAALWFDAEVIIHGPLNPLLAAEIPFGCLHGNVAQKELNLLQFAACGMAQLCAQAAKIYVERAAQNRVSSRTVSPRARPPAPLLHHPNACLLDRRIETTVLSKSRPPRPTDPRPP